ncbi:MAG TPA: magnesium transporter CorA family protein [Thermomicrobiales bacterium]|nr:magnesium transporter CorA family protein [Thermomicrobiales bacterium]
MSKSTPGRALRTLPGAGRLSRSSGARRRPIIETPAPETNYRLVEHGGMRWYDIQRPTSADLDYLRDEFSVHPLLIDDIVSRSQRPKLDLYDDYLFLVMHFPVHLKQTRTTIASEVDIVIGPDYIVTTHDGNLKPLMRVFESAIESEETRQALMSQTTAHLLYYVIDRLVDYCFPVVGRLTDRIEEIEDAIFSRSDLRLVQEISIVRRDLIAMRRIIKPQLPVISQLEHRAIPLVQSDIDVYFGDIADHLAKLWDSLEDLKEVLEGLSDTFDSLATHRLNGVIKTLTVISVLILPLTFITGIFGMNVPIPYESSEYALLVISAVLLMITFVMLAAFRRRGWV